jgi:hypothetical protein
VDEEFTVNEAVASTHALEESAFCAVVEKLREVARGL